MAGYFDWRMNRYRTLVVSLIEYQYSIYFILFKNNLNVTIYYKKSSY